MKTDLGALQLALKQMLPHPQHRGATNDSDLFWKVKNMRAWTWKHRGLLCQVDTFRSGMGRTRGRRRREKKGEEEREGEEEE